jgi:WD40 repeat protein
VEDEGYLNKSLPVDIAESDRSKSATQPWLLHSLPVNALNFCAFSMTFLDLSSSTSSKSASELVPSRVVLFAVPNALDSGGIDIFHLPSERRITTIASDSSTKTGMVMAVNMFVSSSGDVYVVSAYEDGHVMVFIHKGPLTPASFEIGTIASNPWKWDKLYASRPHSQPVLSLDVSSNRDYFITSSADALLIKHPIPSSTSPGYIPTAHYTEDKPLKTVNTKHSGQQGLRMRSDGKIFATAGWDSRVRVYSGKTMKELAVLKWHKEGCYTVAIGDADPLSRSTPAQTQDPSTSGGPVETSSDQVSSDQRPSLAAIHNQRNQKIQQTHWLAAGSKDGKISLWDIY